MALIIKGEMPKSNGCDGCEFQTSRCGQMDACTCYMFDGVIHNFHNERHEDCPIIGEIPDKHGELKDVSILLHYLSHMHGATEHDNDLLREFEKMIRECPTVVEATE